MMWIYVLLYLRFFFKLSGLKSPKCQQVTYFVVTNLNDRHSNKIAEVFGFRLTNLENSFKTSRNYPTILQEDSVCIQTIQTWQGPILLQDTVGQTYLKFAYGPEKTIKLSRGFRSYTDNYAWCTFHSFPYELMRNHLISFLLTLVSKYSIAAENSSTTTFFSFPSKLLLRLLWPRNSSDGAFCCVIWKETNSLRKVLVLIFL